METLGKKPNLRLTNIDPNCIYPKREEEGGQPSLKGMHKGSPVGSLHHLGLEENVYDFEYL